MKVLIVEDEKEIGEFIKKGLEAESFVVDITPDGGEGLSLALENDYDLILLDMYLPKINGLSIASCVRKTKSVPIIVITIDPDVEMKVQMLAYCDDYVTKPFSLNELIARIHAVLRRGEVRHGDIIEVGELKMEVSKCQVTMKGDLVKLRNKEFTLLEYFMRNPGIVLSREKLLEKVWGSNSDPFTNTVDVHVRGLRKNIDEKYKIKFIHTVSGRGYKLDVV